MPAITHLLYLHGFRSSPASAKAKLMAHAVAQRHPQAVWCCPQLPPSPRQAMDGVAALVRSCMAGFPGVKAGALRCGTALAVTYGPCGYDN